MLKRIILMLLAVFLVVGVIAWHKMQFFQQMGAMKAGMASAKQVVSTGKAVSEQWTSELEAVGSVRAAKGVDISNELSGVVEGINFKSGDDVKEGALLLKLRAEDDIAKVNALNATAKLAEIVLNRDKKQLKVQAVAQATVDTDAANLANARALAAAQQALVDKKLIRAPFSGHLGIRNIDVGQYLTPGTAIVTLQQLDPVYLDFNLPQQSISQVKVGQKITAKSDSYPGRKFEGEVSAINPKVDVTTRNIQIRATLPNDDHALLPGMYATADISVGEPGRFITLPQTAITYNPYGDTVFIVRDKNQQKESGDKDAAPKADAEGKPASDRNLVVEQTFVTLGKTRGDQVQILKGLKEGDTVVTSGQLKLQNGSGITVNNEHQPKNDADPKPVDK